MTVREASWNNLLENPRSIGKMWSEPCFSEWEEEILLYLDNELPPEGRARVELHLQRCVHCQRFMGEQRRIETELGFDLRLKQRAHSLPADFTHSVTANLPGMKPLPFVQRWLIAWENTWRPDDWWAGICRHAAVAVSLLLLLLVGGGSSLLDASDENYGIQIVEVGKRAFTLPMGNMIANDSDHTVMYRLPDYSHILALPKTSFHIDSYQHLGDDRAIRIARGEIWCDVLPTSEGFSVKTPHATVRVIGTRFAVKVALDKTGIDVVRGQVLAEKREGGMPKTAAVLEGHKTVIPRRGRIQFPSRIEAGREEQIAKAFNRVDEFRQLLPEIVGTPEPSSSDRKNPPTRNPKPKDAPLFHVPKR